MSVFSAGGIGIDFGSENTRVALESEGVVLTEPTCVLSAADSETDVIAIGKEARRLNGRTDRDSVLLEPVQYGGVAHSELAAMCLLAAAEKATEKRRPFEKNKLAVTFPEGATRVEKNALSNAILLAGGKKSLMVKSVVAAAIGSDVRIDRPVGTLLISIGAHTTEVSILSLSGVVASRTMKTGSGAFNEAIIRYIRRENGLLIGPSTAESLKKDIGSAVEPTGNVDTVILRGRNVLTGKPATETISARDVYHALNEPVRAIVESIMDALYNVPPELTGDVLEGGIHLTGGGALLHGLSDRIQKETQLKVSLTAHPEADAALGACKIASDERLAKNLVAAFSAFEVM